jgi:hypothetical protein
MYLCCFAVDSYVCKPHIEQARSGSEMSYKWIYVDIIKNVIPINTLQGSYVTASSEAVLYRYYIGNLIF